MALLELLFPNRCLECTRVISGKTAICQSCFDQIPFTHHQYGASNDLTQKCRLLFPVEHALALMHFEKENASQKLIHQLKYGGREKLGLLLAKWVNDAFDFTSDTPDLFATVPLHPRKQRQRGYNQLHIFGNELSRLYEIPCDHGLIKRNIYKKAQALQTQAQRDFTEELFSVTKPLQNHHVLLIDDVFTTGNTMSAVAWQILQSGNNRVSVLVLAMD